MVGQIGAWIRHHEKNGIFQPQIRPNQYRILGHTIWMIITFWMTQQKVSNTGKSNEGTFKETVWNQFLPIFTPVGLMEYEAIILPQLKLVNMPDL